jgi:putative OPT family oligopeptide transporter
MAQRAMREATLRAVVMGIVFGALFGAANAYLGLRVGFTIATSIPVAVMTVALPRMFGSRVSILEANLAQTIGSASTSLATGAIFTLPALWLWLSPPGYFQIAGLALCGGVLGVSAMIPLRRLLIVRGGPDLPYPEGRACAEVLRATAEGDTSGRWIFYGLGIGAAVKLALGLLAVLPSSVHWAVPHVLRGELALEIAPALVGVGFILGYRQAAVCVSGGVISALMVIPLAATLLSDAGGAVPDTATLWATKVRYVGTGAVACAGIVTVIRGLPAMAAAFTAVIKGLGTDGSAAPGRSDRDVPGWVIGAGIAAVMLAVALVPGLLAGSLSVTERLVPAAGVAVFGLIFVAVASRIVGIVGVSSQPTSGITLVTLLAMGLVFSRLGLTDPGAKLALLTCGTIVATAASKAGDISQDLKTGHLVGATPALQQLGQYLGAATACWAVAATLLFLGNEFGFGGKDLPAPQAALMKTVIEGQMNGSLPWGLVLAGAGLAAGAMLAGLQGLAFAIGVYLPLASMMPIFVGGIARLLVERTIASPGAPGASPVSRLATAGILAASGLVAGEGLAGVVIAALFGGKVVDKPTGTLIGGELGQVLATLLVVATVGFLVLAGRDHGKPLAPAERAPSDPAG